MKNVLNHIKVALFIVGIILAGNIYAQDAVVNKGNLQIHAGASFFAFGNLSNNSSGGLINNGNLYVNKDLANDQSSMTAGTGTLFLNGSSTQTISGSQIFKTYNLNSNNNAGITLNNDLSVAGAHTFVAGLIATSSTPNYLVYEAGSSYTGDGDSKHINGWVKKYGNTDFTFPVGDATYERTTGLVNLSASSEFNCKYLTPTPTPFNVQVPLVMADAAEYWQIDEVSGGTAQVALNWDNSKVPFPNVLLSSIVVADNIAGSWASDGGNASGNVTSTGNITSNAKSSFGPFTFGFPTYALPLNLISFTAQKRTGYVLTQWITENEQNVNHFEVQRSNDAINFSTMGTVGARNLSYSQQYEFEDHSPLQPINFYRLKSVDNDGKYTYSKIVAITDGNLQNDGTLTVVNPAHNAITIFNRTMQSGEFNYSLSNVAGQILQRGILNLNASSVSVLQLSSITPAGTYLLDIRKGETIFKRKVVLQ